MQKYVSFSVNKEEFALPIKNTSYIEQVPDITNLPNVRDWVKGICTIRGNVVPLIDLKKLLFKQPTDLNEHTRIIGIHINDKELGLVVEEAKEVLDISNDHIQQVTTDISEQPFEVAQMNCRLILILEPQQFLDQTPLQDVFEKIKSHVGE